jgi:hypothetical protein
MPNTVTSLLAVDEEIITLTQRLEAIASERDVLLRRRERLLSALSAEQKTKQEGVADANKKHE